MELSVILGLMALVNETLNQTLSHDDRMKCSRLIYLLLCSYLVSSAAQTSCWDVFSNVTV